MNFADGKNSAVEVVAQSDLQTMPFVDGGGAM